MPIRKKKKIKNKCLFGEINTKQNREMMKQQIIIQVNRLFKYPNMVNFHIIKAIRIPIGFKR